MTPERWARLAELFDLACQQPAAAREAWLAAATDDEGLRAELRAMLAAYERDPSFLEDAADPGLAVGEAVAGALAGRRLGAWRLTRQIGRGGMGVVYEAVRDDRAFDRRVAVKILPAWRVDALAERFRVERRLLGGLDHPGIARLLDAGSSDDGVPYCVMEFVDGAPIDEWCRTRQLDVRARVALMEGVCAAVAYAHAHLVVHRDLKPSNILVAADGQPKLLDFGIATLLDADSGEAVSTTRTGFTSFTPEFASPEQMRGERVTTATDVYSLGVLLYLLLADQRPYDLRGLTAAEALQVVCEREPAAPSAVAPVAARARLRGDLDVIVGKALRKDAGDRYAGVSALAADLQAWRERRPIAAAPATWADRASRFVRRNAAAVAAAAVVAVAVLAGTAATAWQARIAERERARADARFNDVRRLANAVVGPLYDAIAKVPGSTEARQLLVREALTYLDRLSAQAGDDVALASELADAYEKIGDVQGNLYGPNLGDAAGAKTSYARLIALRRAVDAARPGDAAARAGLANAEIRLADMALGESRYADAAAGYQRAVDILGAAATTAPNDGQAVIAGRAHGRLGVALNWAGRRAEATASFERARRVVEPWAARPDASPQVRFELMSTLGNAGDVHYLEERFAPALESYEAALAMARAAAARTPTAPARRSVHLIATRVAAAMQELGRFDDAAALAAEAVAIQRELAVADAKNVRLQFDLAASMQGQAVIEFRRRRFEAAAGLLRESLTLFDAGLAASPESREQRFNYAQTLAWQGRVEAARGRPRDGVAALQRAVAIYAEPEVSARKPSERFEVTLWLGDALAASARAGGGEPARRQALAAYAAARDGLAALVASGQPEPRLAELQRAVEASRVALDRR